MAAACSRGLGTRRVHVAQRAIECNQHKQLFKILVDLRRIVKVFILRCRAGCWWIGALRGNPATRAGTLAEVDHRAVLVSYFACERSRTAEPARNTTAVAIRPACDCWWSERIAVVAILHSETRGAEAVAGETYPKLRLD
jgi:hypothetical protein